MKPKNFPERKRQRQFAALERLSPKTKAGASNLDERKALLNRVAKDLRDVRTKKNRSSSVRFRAIA
jgi:hypothetical protein